MNIKKCLSFVNYDLHTLKLGLFPANKAHQYLPTSNCLSLVRLSK